LIVSFTIEILETSDVEENSLRVLSVNAQC
jgi:hypothetical protein